MSTSFGGDRSCSALHNNNGTHAPCVAAIVRRPDVSMHLILNNSSRGWVLSVTSLNNEGTEAQGGQVTWGRPHSWRVAEGGSPPGSLAPECASGPQAVLLFGFQQNHCKQAVDKAVLRGHVRARTQGGPVEYWHKPSLQQGYLQKLSGLPGCRANPISPFGPYLFRAGAHRHPLWQIGLCRHTSSSSRYPQGQG